MNSNNRYLSALIIAALFGLIALQVVWLSLVYDYKAQELLDKTRSALLATTGRLQKLEDSKLIVKNIDSLLLTDQIFGTDSGKSMRVIVSKLKHKLKIDTITQISELKHIENSDNDSTVATTVIKLGDEKSNKIIIKSESISESNIKKKAGDLEALFVKMAMTAQHDKHSVASRIDLNSIQSVLSEELEKQGIQLKPEIHISTGMALNDTAGEQTILITPAFNKHLLQLITLPLFADDIGGSNMKIEIGYVATGMHLFKQMAGLLTLSLLVSVLIAFVIIYVFKKMLSHEKLHRLKNDFINNMTHELKTPIATISLAVDAINNPVVKNDEQKFANYTRILKEENIKLNTHVERVLQIAQLDKGELVLEKKAVSLNQLLQQAIATYSLHIEKQNAHVNIHTNEELKCFGDATHLLSVFTNLLDNALKYAKPECKIDISLTHSNGNAIISFRDNGIGIDSALKEKIFEKFYRVQGGNVHDVKGFGLGLSYVRSVVNAHGGSVHVMSEVNKGAEFIIKLPLYV